MLRRLDTTLEGCSKSLHERYRASRLPFGMTATCLMMQIMHAQAARNSDEKAAQKACTNAEMRAMALLKL